MARIRTIKPEFWADEKLAPQPPVVRLVFLGLMSLADDAGRLVDNVKTIDGLIFPETDDTSREALDILATMGRVIRYQAESGQRLIQVANWEKHQKVDKPSKYVLPAPSAENLIPQGDTEGSRISREGVANVSRDGIAPTVDLRPTTSDQLPANEHHARMIEQHRESAAGIIRTVLWLSDKPPATAGPDWSIERELDIWDTFAREHPVDVLNGAYGVIRDAIPEVLGRKEPATGRLLAKTGGRDLLNRCMAYWRKKQESKIADRVIGGLRAA